MLLTNKIFIQTIRLLPIFGGHAETLRIPQCRLHEQKCVGAQAYPRAKAFLPRVYMTKVT